VHYLHIGYRVLLCCAGRNLLVVVGLSAGDGKNIRVTTAETITPCGFFLCEVVVRK
jgi:hypothetical protein